MKTMPQDSPPDGTLEAEASYDGEHGTKGCGGREGFVRPQSMIAEGDLDGRGDARALVSQISIFREAE